VGSHPTHGCCAPTQTQRAIPPGSEWVPAKAGGHTTWCNSPHPWSGARAGVRLRATGNRDQRRHGPMRLRKDFSSLLLSMHQQNSNAWLHMFECLESSTVSQKPFATYWRSLWPNGQTAEEQQGLQTVLKLTGCQISVDDVEKEIWRIVVVLTNVTCDTRLTPSRIISPVLQLYRLYIQCRS